MIDTSKEHKYKPKKTAFKQPHIFFAFNFRCKHVERWSKRKAPLPTDHTPWPQPIAPQEKAWNLSNTPKNKTGKKKKKRKQKLCCRFKYTLTCRDFIHAKISIVCAVAICVWTCESRDRASWEEHARLADRYGSTWGRAAADPPRIWRWQAGRAAAAGHGGARSAPRGARTLHPTYHRADTFFFLSFFPPFSQLSNYFLWPPPDASYWGKSGSGKRWRGCLKRNSERATWPMNGNQPG